jgi:DNA primase
MMDTTQLKQSIDLREFALSKLGEPIHRSGKQAMYRCPFHGEKHGTSLAVYPDGWTCFGKCQESGDAISFVMKLDSSLTFQDAIRTLGGDPTIQAPKRQPVTIQVPPDAEPPEQRWQDLVWDCVGHCQDLLWSPAGESAMNYLTIKRGLTPDTIRASNMGYWPGDPMGGSELFGVYIRHGITIPWLWQGDYWALKVRLSKDPMRYWQIGGGNIAGGIYVARYAPKRPILVVEGEFNALAAAQVCHDLTIISIGSASYSINPRWYPMLSCATRIYALFDDDQSGHKGADRMGKLSARVKRVNLPVEVKDLNDWLLADPSAMAEWLNGLGE